MFPFTVKETFESYILASGSENEVFPTPVAKLTLIQLWMQST